MSTFRISMLVTMVSSLQDYFTAQKRTFLHGVTAGIYFGVPAEGIRLILMVDIQASVSFLLFSGLSIHQGAEIVFSRIAIGPIESCDCDINVLALCYTCLAI